jgi:FAD/FMN-containing dehydrogenase
MLAPITDPGILEAYLTDASNVRGEADGLLRPETVEEVAAIVRHCQRHSLPLTVAAGRTSTTGGPVPHGGWVLSMERMNRVIAIDHDFAEAEAGVYLGAFQAEIEAKGRFFPPDPTSRLECTLGAAVACNASGARSFRYGPTRPWIEALEVVLPTGEICEVRRGDPVPSDWPVPAWDEPRVKTAAGYAPPADLLDLFIGQEGTLGVITRVRVRLTDLPAAVMGVLAFFPDRPTAVDFVERARAAARADRAGALSPRCLEYLDRACLELAQARVGAVPEGARAALFCEQEVVAAHGEDGHLAAWWEALEASGALVDDTLVTTDPAGQAKLHALRHAIPAGINERVVANGMPKVGTDLSVPDAALSEMMDLYEAAPGETVLFGHIGDNHLHLNLLPRSADELAEAKAWYLEAARAAVRLGGSVSGEHGIGKLKKPYLAMMVPPEVLASFRALKARLDPAWILGRGTLFDPA